jgi:hypothetical protein
VRKQIKFNPREEHVAQDVGQDSQVSDGDPTG